MLSRTLSGTGRPIGLFFFILKGAIRPAPETRVQSLATEGGQKEELKTCLREYHHPQRGINGRNRVPKATFYQLPDIHLEIFVEPV